MNNEFEIFLNSLYDKRIRMNIGLSDNYEDLSKTNWESLYDYIGMKIDFNELFNKKNIKLSIENKTGDGSLDNDVISDIPSLLKNIELLVLDNFWYCDPSALNEFTSIRHLEVCRKNIEGNYFNIFSQLEYLQIFHFCSFEETLKIESKSLKRLDIGRNSFDYGIDSSVKILDLSGMSALNYLHISSFIDGNNFHEVRIISSVRHNVLKEIIIDNCNYEDGNCYIKVDKNILDFCTITSK